MNDVLFRTDGTWDGTTLHNHGYEVPAAQLYLELRAGRDDWDEPTAGGVAVGADLTALVRPAENPDAPFDLLPGRVALEFPGASVVLENLHPAVDPRHTRVTFNGEDVTERVVELVVDINAVDNVTDAWISIYKNRWFRRDEVVTHALLG